ncbi:MAG: response regulator [Planctomycetota bacterium]
MADGQTSRNKLIEELKSAREQIARLSREKETLQRLEEGRKELLLRQQHLLENVPAAIFLKDSEMRYVAVNRAYHDLLPKGVDDPIGKRDRDLFPKKFAAAFEAEDRKVLVDGQTITKEEPIRMRDGRVAHMSVSLTPVHAGDGRITGMVGIAFDVTERKRSEERIQNLLNQQQHLLENVPACIFLKDTELRYVAVNRAYHDLLPASVDDPTGLRDRDIFPKKLAREFEKEDRKVIVDGQTVTKEEQIKLRGGRVAQMSVSLTPVSAADGRITGMVGIAFDVTEQKRVQQELREAKKAAEAAKEARSMFLANMSHEIRTPMNGIIGFANLALRTNLDRVQSDYVNKIRTSANALLGIINDILDFSKIEAGKLGIEQTGFQLQDVLEDLADLFANQAAEKDIEMIIARDPDVPSALFGDPLRLRQVLVNLTSNAVKFTEGGEIFINVAMVSETDDKVTLSFRVQDTGIGISKENLGKLFAAFTQADGSTTRRYGGTGLGLAISRQLVNLMGGEIEVASEVGRGTTFSFALPFKKQGKEKERRHKLSVDIRGLRAMVVDDNRTTQMVLLQMLESFGLKAVVAASAKDALAKLRYAAETDKPYQLVLMDWRMPGMDGLEASKEIRGDDKLAEIPIVMVTAFGSEYEMQKGDGLGINAFLTKPVQQSVLFNTLMEVLGQEQMQEAAGERHIVTKESLRVAPLQGVRVLLAEDNAINQEVAIKLLTDAGLEVDIATNGREAVAAVKKKFYDAVLMDVQMPEMDGYEATNAIREEARLDQLPIIAMTAHAMDGDREKCLEAGMNDYVSKPINPDHLFEVLQKWTRPVGEGAKAETPAAGKAPVQADAASVLPPLPGVDVNAGLNRLRGDAVLYRRLLRDFARKHGNAADEIAEALTSNETFRVRSLAHSLKGLAGNLSVTGLAAAAGELETAAREEKTEELPARADAVRRTLMQALDSLKALEVPPPVKALARTTERISASDLRPMLVKLKQLLAASDPEAEDTVGSLSKHLIAWELEKEARKLGGKIAAFDFDGAQETLKKIADAIGISLQGD